MESGTADPRWYLNICFGRFQKVAPYLELGKKKHAVYWKNFLFRNSSWRVTIAHRIDHGPFVQMIGNKHSIRLLLPVSVVLALFVGRIAQADQPALVHSYLIEAFTITDLPVTGETDIKQQTDSRETELQVYGLDGIQRIEANLSQGLTADPEQSKQIVLQRLQQLGEDDRARMQQASVGLAKAMQYGVDRYPTIVFDGKVAVYGLTDLSAALDHYQRWLVGGRP